jgi:hypothetical protein
MPAFDNLRTVARRSITKCLSAPSSSSGVSVCHSTCSGEFSMPIASPWRARATNSRTPPTTVGGKMSTRSQNRGPIGDEPDVGRHRQRAERSVTVGPLQALTYLGSDISDARGRPGFIHTDACVEHCVDEVADRDVRWPTGGVHGAPGAEERTGLRRTRRPRTHRTARGR